MEKVISTQVSVGSLVAENFAAAEVFSKYGIDFLYRDFRPFYRQGKNEAYKRGYYLQKYCGCIYSYNESDHKKKPVYDF